MTDDDGSEPAALADFASDTYSQFGEDGIIAEVLRRVAAAHPLDRWCVDVGAWDGVFLSNTARLLREEGYRGVLLEGDPDKVALIESNFAPGTVIARTAIVGFEGPGRLDALLAATAVPADFDLLSIDIDGCDYHVFAAMDDYRPKVVVLEFNYAVPNEVDFVQARDLDVRQGTGPGPIVALGRRMGYALAAVTFTNVILVHDSVADAVLGAARPTLAELRDDSDHRCFIFPAFDGTLITSKSIGLPWHWNVEVPPAKLQFLPSPVRRERHEYRPWQRALFGATVAVKVPDQVVRKVRMRYADRLGRWGLTAPVGRQAPWQFPRSGASVRG